MTVPPYVFFLFLLLYIPLRRPEILVPLYHILPFWLPGGEKAIQEPRRAALGLLFEMYGKKVGPEIHEFLLIQARLGIHRKNLDKFEDQAMIEETEEEIQKLQAEMNEIRRSVGTYVMMSVRNIFPPDESPLWGQLENTIADRIKTAPTSPGGGLWGALESATKASDTDNG